MPSLKSAWKCILLIVCIVFTFGTLHNPHPGVEGAGGKVETYEFQAEVTRLMDIIVNSLYSNKDIFLRELISNASDALDKIRFMSLTDPSVLGEGDMTELGIQISVDHENKMLKIRDTGIGMTKDDLINNLGTIARSGTSSFIDKFVKGSDGSSSDLIGQFGVGFYSVYLVSSKVQVITKNNDDDKQYLWESSSDGSFTVTEDEQANYENEDEFVDLKRGTELRIYLRDDVFEEYSDEDNLFKLIKKYSEFINFPISLLQPEQEEIPPEERAPPAGTGNAVDEDTDEDDTEDESDDDKENDKEEDNNIEVEPEPQFRTVYKWNVVNSSKSIWTKPSAEVTKEEYDNLYTVLAKSSETQAQTYLEKTHFKAEGDIEFKAILYIPSKPNDDFFERQLSEEERKGAKLKLYVRRVFITDSFTEVMPSYLAFIVGVVDSDTLPLNVSRETLQQHGSMKTIRKKLVRKALDTIKKIADDDDCYEEEDDQDNDDDEKEEEENGEKKKKCKITKYEYFYSKYSAMLKNGFIEDTPNRSRLIKLLRFTTSKDEESEKKVSLQTYVDRAKEGQKYIYYIADMNMESIKQSPALEVLKKKGYEVLYCTDAIDEWVMQSGVDYDDMTFMNVNSEGLKLLEEDDILKKDEKSLMKKYKPFLKWWKSILTDPTYAMSNVEDVRLSNRLEDSPATVVNSKFSYSANMDRILSHQVQGHQAGMQSRKILEINVKHPIIKKIKSMYEDVEGEESGTKNDKGEDPEKNIVYGKGMALMVYQTALIQAGFDFNKLHYSQSVFGFLGDVMGIGDEEVDTEFDVTGFEEEEEVVVEDIVEEEEDETEEEDEQEGDNESITEEDDVADESMSEEEGEL